MAREDGMGGNIKRKKKGPLTASERFKKDVIKDAKKAGINTALMPNIPAAAYGSQSFDTPFMNEGYMEPLTTQKQAPIILTPDLGPPTRRNINIAPLVKFNPENDRNVGYGPRGNIFPGSTEERSAMDSIYGGTGSDNAAAREAMGESMVSTLARKRLEEERRDRLAGRNSNETPGISLSKFPGK